MLRWNNTLWLDVASHMSIFTNYSGLFQHKVVMIRWKLGMTLAPAVQWSFPLRRVVSSSCSKRKFYSLCPSLAFELGPSKKNFDFLLSGVSSTRSDFSRIALNVDLDLDWRDADDDVIGIVSSVTGSMQHSLWRNNVIVFATIQPGSLDGSFWPCRPVPSSYTYMECSLNNQSQVLRQFQQRHLPKWRFSKWLVYVFTICPFTTM